MAEYSIKQLKAALEELACCPVCEARMTNDVVCCVNGHGVCGNCRREEWVMSECPTCRQPFRRRGQPTLLRQLLEALPEDCPNSGCGRLVKLKEHSQFCGFRLVGCLICVSVANPSLLESHYDVEHNNNIVYGDMKNYQVSSEKSYQDKVLFLVTGDQLFQVTLSLGQKVGDWVTFSWIPLEEMYTRQEVTYEASVTFLDGDDDSPALVLKTTFDLKKNLQRKISFYSLTYRNCINSKNEIRLSISFSETTPGKTV